MYSNVPLQVYKGLASEPYTYILTSVTALQAQRNAHRLINEHGLSGRCSDFWAEGGRAKERASERASQSLKPRRNYSSYRHRWQCAGRAWPVRSEAATVIIWAILF